METTDVQALTGALRMIVTELAKIRAELELLRGVVLRKE